MYFFSTIFFTFFKRFWAIWCYNQSQLNTDWQHFTTYVLLLLDKFIHGLFIVVAKKASVRFSKRTTVQKYISPATCISPAASDVYNTHTRSNTQPVRWVFIARVLDRHQWSLNKRNNNLSCCCDSRSYCLPRTVAYTGKVSNRFRLQVDERLVRTIRFNGYGVYKCTQTQSTQAWRTKVHEVSE